jgi:uncharacterized membrane protein
VGKFLGLLLVVAFVAYLIPAPVSHRTASVEIHATREKVWEVLSNLERIPAWNPSARSIEFETQHKQGDGVKFRLQSSPISRVFHVREWRAYNRIEFGVKTEPDLTRGHVVVYQIRPAQTRTVVQLDEDYHMRGGYLGYMLDQVYIGPSGERSRAAALANLKRLVETGGEMFQR